MVPKVIVPSQRPAAAFSIQSVATVDGMSQWSKQIVRIQRSKIPQLGQESSKHVTDMCKTPSNENLEYICKFHLTLSSNSGQLSSGMLKTFGIA